MARSWEPLLAPDVTWNAVSTPPGGWTFHTTCISHATHVPLDPFHTFNIQEGRGGEDSSSKEEEDGNEEDGDSRTILTFEKLMPRPHAQLDEREIIPCTICCPLESDPFFVSESKILRATVD